MRVIIVDEDAQRIERIRKMLSKAGVYGWRITAHTVKSLNELPYPSNFANVIVSEREMFPGSIKERTRLLRPSGGISWICRSEKIEHKKDKLPGSGEWSHLYGLPDNSAFGGETLAGVKSTNDLQVQWMGKPGPRAQPDRSGRKPSPLSVNGRLFVQGLHRLIALDAYNGTLLWEWELPTLERFNMPRDCSNWCADDDYVYVAMGSHCWQLDAQTGRLIKVHEVTVGNRKDWNYDWSYLARMGEQLIGSAVKMDTAFTNFWGDANHGWYDAVGGPATFNVCSENLFARDLKSGKNTWHYPNGVILNSTITITPTRVYFVECRNNKVKASNSRRVGMSELWDDQYLIALDLDTGKKVYERPLKTEKGIVVFYLAHGDGRLVLASSSNKRYDVYAFDAATGKREWHQQFGWFKGKGDHGKAMSRPAIVNNRVYVRPGVMDLSTGKLLPVSMPQGGCGTYAATENLFIFRNSNITVWDTNKNTSTSWNRLRPGCWLSTIPAGGMLLSPEAGGGCSCGSWMETSIGFAPKHKR